MPGRVATDLPEIDSLTVELWPVTDGEEPDVRIIVLVEGKLGASKSGVGDVYL